MENPNTKKLAEIRSYLQKKAEELEKELHYVNMLISMIDQALSEKSFVPASTLVPERKVVEDKMKPPLIETPLEEIIISTRDGVEVCKINVYENIIIVKPLIELFIDIPPFRSFLIGRIFEGYKKKDEKRVYDGEISPEEVFNYEIISDDNKLKELRILNYGSKQRLNELKGVIRWTFIKMYERLKT